MQAAWLSEARKCEVVSIPRPVPEPGEVLIRVEANGICGTDIKSFLGTYRPGTVPHGAGSRDRRNRVGPARRPGRAIARHPGLCRAQSQLWACRLCLQGLPNLCEDYHVLGESIKYPGGCARFVCVSSRQVHALPAHVTAIEGALVQPYAISNEAVIRRGQVAPGKRVLVLGAGPIGLTIMLIARQLGAGR